MCGVVGNMKEKVGGVRKPAPLFPPRELYSQPGVLIICIETKGYSITRFGESYRPGQRIGGEKRMCLEIAGIDLDVLISEFAEFRLNDDGFKYESSLFVRSLTTPLPRFAEKLLGRTAKSKIHADQVRRLYFFLLEKRYTQRLNLLYFAFDIFEDDALLPEDVINQTPFPHEDGIPGYRHALRPGFAI
jgi:hypothetical protein